MARGRVYTVGFAGVTVSAVQDLLGVYAGASMAVELHSFSLGQITQTTIGGVRLRLRRLAATVTQGVGGTAPTPALTMPGDAAATATARTNDTTQATTSGTASSIPDVWNLLNGYLWLPPIDDRPIIKPSEAFIVSLDTAPASGLVCSGNLTFAELW
jgi:hypothetical protein